MKDFIKNIKFNKMYTLGIDASNIRSGGGVTHLIEVLRNANPESYGFSKVIIWSNKATLSKIDDKDWLVKIHDKHIDGSLLRRIYWQRFCLKKNIQSLGCNLLFVPGGLDKSSFKPMVTMHRNLLPFEFQELMRYGFSFETIRLLILRFTQISSFKRANGVIFLTQYAKNSVLKITGELTGNTVLIPHGVDERFFVRPKKQKNVNDFDKKTPVRLIYVSSIELYKHQWNVVEAVSILHNAGIHVSLDLIGAPQYPAAVKRLQLAMNKFDPHGQYIHYRGSIDHDAIHKEYLKADIAVFASSCETFGQILIEAISSGLPVACSNISAMPELLGDTGAFFDPMDPESIAGALKILIDSAELRSKNASNSFELARSFSWKRCSNDTFAFLKSCLTIDI